MSKSRNRNVGHAKEVCLVKRFNSVGYPHVKTSRACNRFRDSQKIDLAHDNESVQGQFPFNIQSKDVTTLNVFKTFEEIPKQKDIINILAVTKREKKGSQFRKTGEYIMMTEDDFFSMLDQLCILKGETIVLHN